MYIVQMRRFTAAQARQEFSELLNQAEAQREVVIERRGVQFALTVKPRAPSRPTRRARRITVVDPRMQEGQWSWTWEEGETRLTVSKGRRR